MKVEVQNKKGLRTVLSIIIDKKKIQEKLEEKLSKLQSEVSLKSNFFLISFLSTIIDKVVFKPFFDCICTFIIFWWARRDSNS